MRKKVHQKSMINKYSRRKNIRRVSYGNLNLKLRDIIYNLKSIFNFASEVIFSIKKQLIGINKSNNLLFD